MKIVERKKIREEDKRFLEILFVEVLSAVLILLGTSNRLFVFGAFVLDAGYMCLRNNEKSLLLLYFLLPFANVFKLAVEGTSFFTYLILWFVLIAVLRRRSFPKRFLVPLVLFVVINFIGCAGNYTSAIKQSIIPVVIFITFYSSEVRIDDIIYNYARGLVLSSAAKLYLSGLLSHLEEYTGNLRAWGVTSREIYRFSGLYPDPNYYSLAMIIVFAGLMLLIVNNRAKTSAYVYALLIVFFGVQSVSKSFILMLGIVFLFFLYNCLLNRRYVMAFVLIGVAAVGAVVLLSGFSRYFNYVLERIRYSDDLTTGRWASWMQYLSFLAANPFKLLVGSGIGAAFIGSLAAHNTYIDCLYYYGIIGIVIFIISIYKAFKAPPRFRRTFSNYVIMLCVLLMIFFLSCIQYYEFGFTLTYLLLAFATDWKNKGYRETPEASEKTEKAAERDEALPDEEPLSAPMEV